MIHHLLRTADFIYIVIMYLSRLIVENSVDHDQLASEKPADLDLHCFKYKILIFTFSMVKFYGRVSGS